MPLRLSEPCERPLRALASRLCWYMYRCYPIPDDPNAIDYGAFWCSRHLPVSPHISPFHGRP